MDARPAFATLLREYRLAAGLTQEDLADRSRMSVSAIGTLERGTHNAPQRHTVELLAAALELGPKARADLESIAARGRARKPRLKEAAGSGGQAAPGLPLYLTSFVGRETELADARATLREHRLLTITGAGGTGKTHLAATIAAIRPRAGQFRRTCACHESAAACATGRFRARDTRSDRRRAGSHRRTPCE